MATLRSRHGCPWDRKQTHETLRPFLLEEAYELLETIDRREYVDLPGELGDVLFQCVFHAQIGAEAGRFDIVDAVESITDKLVRRHPHVFTASGRALGARKKGASKHGRLRSPGAVVTQWEAIKAREQDTKGQKKRVLAGVPASLPALLGAHEIGTRVAAVGFDWDKTEDVIDKVDEEVRELREALGQSRARASEELGDLLFSIANLSRKLGLEPESALRQANEKFSRRFGQVEARLEAQGTSVHQASQADMERAWQDVKRKTPRNRRNAPTSKRVTPR